MGERLLEPQLKKHWPGGCGGFDDFGSMNLESWENHGKIMKTWKYRKTCENHVNIQENPLKLELLTGKFDNPGFCWVEFADLFRNLCWEYGWFWGVGSGSAIPSIWKIHVEAWCHVTRHRIIWHALRDVSPQTIWHWKMLKESHGNPTGNWRNPNKNYKMLEKSNEIRRIIRFFLEISPPEVHTINS